MVNRRRVKRESGAPDRRVRLLAAGTSAGNGRARPPGRTRRRLRITPTRLDRLLVLWIATALLVWLWCLILLWAWVLDSSPATTLQAVGATLLAIAAGMGLLRPLGGASRRVLQWLRLEDALAMELTAEGGWVGREDLLAMTRLLGAVAVFSGLCGLVSTAAVLAGQAVVDWLTQRLLWTPSGWAVLKFVVQFLAAVPISVGLATAFRASSMVRSGSGRDPYAAVFREWLAACGLSCVLFAGLWLVGADLLGAARTAVLGGALMTGVVLLAAAVVLFQRPREKRRPRRVAQAAGAPRRGAWLSTGGVFLGMGIGLAVQVRLVGDATGAGPVGTALWVGLSAWLLVRFLSVEDRRSRPAGRAQAIGAAVGAVTAVVIQGVLAASSLALRRDGEVSSGAGLLLLAAAMQIPAIALVAVIVSRGRMLFARAGGSAKGYAARACAAGGAALLVFVLAMGSGGGRIALLVAAGAGLAACAVGGAATARGSRKRVQWIACGAALILALAGGVIGSVWAAGPITVGPWLTSPGGGWKGVRVGGLIPAGAWQSQGVSAALAQTLRQPSLHGRWWVLSPAGRELPHPLPPQIWVSANAPDRGAVRCGPWRQEVAKAQADFLTQTRIGRGRPDGILLAPLPADHPQAWRYYDELVLMRCRRRLHQRERSPRGVLALRTGVARRRVSKVMSLAGTFHRVMGSGWAVLGFGDSRVDLLLLGPAELVPRPRSRQDAFVVEIGRLTARRGLDADELAEWLRSASGKAAAGPPEGGTTNGGRAGPPGATKKRRPG